jgi:hypothetical protein
MNQIELELFPSGDDFVKEKTKTVMSSRRKKSILLVQIISTHSVICCMKSVTFSFKQNKSIAFKLHSCGLV